MRSWLPAFAFGVPCCIHGFHPYTASSSSLESILVSQYPTPFPGWAGGFEAGLERPPTDPLRPVNPDNACALRITAAAGT